MNKYILYIAQSKDGFIAGQNNDLSFLDKITGVGDYDFEYPKFIKTIDVIIMGRNTYDWIINSDHTWPYGGKTVYVLTNREVFDENIIAFSGLIDVLSKKIENKNIWIVGGAEVVNQYIQNQMIDEMFITTVQININSGILLFKSILNIKYLNLISTNKIGNVIIRKYKKK